MFKMVKYEYRRGLMPLTVVFAAFFFVEIYFLIAALGFKDVKHSEISTVLMIFMSAACYIFVLVYGLVSYNNDLKNKNGYLVFMTPLSTFEIIGAKLLTILITGITLIAFIFGLGALDYSIAASVFHFDSFIKFLDEMLSAFGHNVGEIVRGLLSLIVAFLLQFYMITTIAYLAISLSSTVLQNKKGKNFVSGVIFVAIYALVNVITAGYLNNTSLLRAENIISEMYPVLILYAVVIIICYVGSSLLLDRKISL